ncbi:MAG: DNA-binding response regulator [Verrucomicrobia bacterium]|nr:MAG: DNA-binding response regulator [Verrucomicrobiota bacterium]
MRLLIIEDHATLRNALVQYFREQGMIVDFAATGDEGLWAATENAYDAIILDLMLPEVDGMVILQKLRACHNPVHIIVVSALDSLDDKLGALNAGADDYLVKPFSLAEALARVRALIRRNFSTKSPLLECKDLTLHTLTRKVVRDGREIELTALEFRLLEYLLYRSGEVVTRAEIWEKVFEDGTGGTSNVVDVYIGYLRKKINIGGAMNLIQTKRGHGYCIES